MNFRRRVVLSLALGALLAGCATTSREPKSDLDDTSAAMREMRTQTISQMKAAGASASQIREMQRQFDTLEKQMRQMVKQVENMERETK